MSLYWCFTFVWPHRSNVMASQCHVNKNSMSQQRFNEWSVIVFNTFVHLWHQKQVRIHQWMTYCKWWFGGHSWCESPIIFICNIYISHTLFYILWYWKPHTEKDNIYTGRVPSLLKNPTFVVIYKTVWPKLSCACDTSLGTGKSGGQKIMEVGTYP